MGSWVDTLACCYGTTTDDEDLLALKLPCYQETASGTDAGISVSFILDRVLCWVA